MPTTVPLTFNYINNSLEFGGRSPLNSWRFQASYTDASGVSRSVFRDRDIDGPSLAPFSLDVDLDAVFPAHSSTTTIFGGSSPGSALDRTYFTANLTIPDGLTNVVFSVSICHGSNSGFTGGFSGPNLSFSMIQPPRISELQPAQEPMPISIDNGPDITYPIISTTTGLVGIRNSGLSALAVTGDIIANWGDGSAEDTQSFSYTLPAATVGYSSNGSGGFTSYMKRVPFLLIKASATLTVVDAPVVTEDSQSSYVVEIRMPRFSHNYTTVDNDTLTMRTATSVTGNYASPGFVYPVANFVQNDDDGVSLDGSNSFDLDSTIVKWTWAVLNFGISSPTEPPFSAPRTITTTPTVSFPGVADGEYYAYLLAESAQGQSSTWRRKHVTVGSAISVAYNERRASWWLLRGIDGQLVVERHLQHEAPTGSGMVIGDGAPGSIQCVGAHLFVTSKNGNSYLSIDEGATWEYIMAIADNITVIATAAEVDGSSKYHLVKDGDGLLQRYVERRNGSGWIVEGPDTVTGLPESTRRPGDASKPGVTILLTAKSDDGIFAATSTDNMLTWTVST